MPLTLPPTPPAEVRPADDGPHDRRVRELRKRLFAADRRCRYCRRGIRKPQQASADHMIPVVRGGTDDAGNVTLCCHACNTAKGDKTPEEWAAAILAAKPAAADDALAWADADAEWGRIALGPAAAPHRA